MTNFAVFANGTFWGFVTADNATAAVEAAAAEWGTEGDVDGLVARPVSAEEAAEVEQWQANGAHADECPACVAH